MSLTVQARVFAVGAHGVQQYGDEPYVVHLDAVAAVVRRFSSIIGPAWRTVERAAYLHDTLEDTRTSREALAQRFGDDVARLVAAVTNEPGATRHERARKTYPKLREAGTLAVALKLSDRIANVEEGLRTKSEQLPKYLEEYAYFRATLRRTGELDPMWRHLDGLFRLAARRAIAPGAAAA